MSLKVNSVTVGLSVSDLNKASLWYGKLFVLEESMSPVDGIVEYLVGPIWLQLFEGSITESDHVLRFETDDIDKEFIRLKDLGILTEEVIEDIPGVLRYLDFKDPDGNQLSFYWLYPNASF
ncbi:Glyoxalase-like domain [Acholeplasma oculi]|uniref:Glyoxalase-like domain-containing protein n=1 Tax=Acholeplasma oculi TaxID=35623 RepID=A0A061AIW2_9MOLU|nr:VOC family protein [Acholeplasma oculi]CDR30937.1 Glyoxalase-like domain-containing protein [Acholeplasma oculi]SKC35636.1 hypothetical protein SAMN02745122_0288 [Acholeplasma oculi]SUT90213.1 Glyoxalase-like domain [Acholeplasma oculi]